MKIVNLIAENVKKIRAVEITPAGEVVTIAGKNGAGKTSILDSIYWAIAGTKHIQDEPIRRGETRARIRLDLGELVVERRFAPGGSSLSVESADGARFKSPQTMLDALIGELSFDPLSFARMDPRKQFDELRRVAKVAVDIDKLDGLNAADFARRTEFNRDAKTARARAEGIAIPPAAEGDVVDESALDDELQRAGEANAEIEQRKARRAQAASDLEAKDKQAAIYRDQSIEYNRLAQESHAEFVALAKEADDMRRKIEEAKPLPDPVDVSALRAKINGARERNRAILARGHAIHMAKALADGAAEFERQAAAITARMEAREAEKRAAIEAAALPVAGLGFGEGVVTFNGIPFEQASSAEKLRVSMGIAMAANPKLRVIRITDGSLLDEDSMRAVGEMAKAEDFQVWVEQVSSDGKVGIVIDDGAVVSTPESRAAPPAQEAPAAEDRAP